VPRRVRQRERVAAPCVPGVMRWKDRRAQLRYPRVPDRAAIGGVLFVLRTSIQWVDLPLQLGCCLILLRAFGG
jgi:hypothetical protein